MFIEQPPWLFRALYPQAIFRMGEIAPGTLFEQLPAEWVCPECAETKDQFVKA